MRLPLTTSLEIEEFVAGQITVPQALVTNGIFLQRADGKVYVTQRPSINIAKDASTTVSDVRGRGIFYWNDQATNYFVNDNKVYKTDYSTEVVEASVTVTNIDGVAGTATATAGSHGYKTNDKITIAGSSSYDGEYVVTVTGGSAFTFPHAATTTGESGTATRRLGAGGHDRVYFLEIGNYLVIIDPEDNTGWYIATGASTVLVEITDTDFPPKQTPALQLALGGAVLDGTLYVMDTTGTLANSGIEDPTTWGSLDFIEAEVEKDGGVALAKHNNHVVAFGNRTIEFFYDAQNPTGSPLGVRQDVAHELGMAKFDTVWNSNNELFFVGQATTGALAVYRMKSFMVEDISPGVMDTYLTSAVNSDRLEMFGSGFTSGHDSYYVLTVYNYNAKVEPVESLVYSTATNTWTRFELMHSGINDCPIIDFAVANATQLGSGILTNGDIVTVADDLSPQDSTQATGGVYEAGVYEVGIYTAASSGFGTDIQMEIITGHTDNETVNRKFMSSLRLVGTPTKASETMTVQWSDESNQDWNTGKTFDLSIPGQRIPRLGSYRQRNFKLTYTPSERHELDALEADITAGNY